MSTAPRPETLTPDAAWEALYQSIGDAVASVVLHDKRPPMNVDQALAFHRPIIEEAIRTEARTLPLLDALDAPEFRAALVKVFEAPGEWGPAQGYYGPYIDHFIDMLRAALGEASREEGVGS